jgi:hypothetical protein
MQFKEDVMTGTTPQLLLHRAQAPKLSLSQSC